MEVPAEVSETAASTIVVDEIRKDYRYSSLSSGQVAQEIEQDDDSSDDESIDDEWRTSSGSESEEEQTDADRQAERKLREIERQRVLEAAGLIVRQSTEARPPPPTRRHSTRNQAISKRLPSPLIVTSSEIDVKVPENERELPPLPLPSPRNLDDAFERYQTFKLQEGNDISQGASNRLSVVSEASTYASTVPPSSPRQSIYTRPPSATLPSSASAHSTEGKISNIFNFLSGRTRTPGEGTATAERKFISVPIISSPIPMTDLSRENSPAFGSVGTSGH